MSRRSSTASSGGRRAAAGEAGRAASTAAGGAASRGGGRAARVLHLDLFSGIAGNMFVGALLDLGLPRHELEADLAGLGVPHALRVRRVRRGPIAARHVEVRVPARREGSASGGAGRPGADGEPHDAPGRPDHGRSYREIRRLLERARLDPAVRRRALAIFEALGRAEARVHGIALDAVHFHEVGAVDAIVDVTAAAAGLERLGIERVTASPVALGSGSVGTAHGRLPLPAPAALELLRGVPTVPAHVDWETVTPTGAAILRCTAEAFGPLPAMTVEAIGHGAGEDRPGPMPNVLRAVLGRAGGARADRIAVLETNLDDLVPEHFDHLMERLFAAGALDVSLQHVQMKKNRPGYLLRVLGRPAQRLALARVLFAESTALGVRTSECERLILEREELRVKTPHGTIRVKRAWDPDGRPLVSAEYDDCKRAALRAGIPLRDVVRAAEEAARTIDK